METVIVKEQGNELIKANFKFRILINRRRYDSIIYEKYHEAKSRLETLKRIFQHSKHEILVIEE